MGISPIFSFQLHFFQTIIIISMTLSLRYGLATSFLSCQHLSEMSLQAEQCLYFIENIDGLQKSQNDLGVHNQTKSQ